MNRKIVLPILLAIVGLGIGSGAGFFLRPAPDPAAETEDAPEAHASGTPEHINPEDPTTIPEYVKMSNQFVIPVLRDGHVTAMVILALSLEVAHGTSDQVYAREPKLRDALLQVLFDHANAGGFDGDFTDGANMLPLRKALFEASVKTIGDNVKDILISDIARQDS